MDKHSSIVASGIAAREAEESKNKRSQKLQKTKKHLTSRSSVSRSAVRGAGKKSSQRGHRGITIKQNKNGSDAAGLISYTQIESKNHEIISTNCDDAQSFISTTNHLSKMRKEIKKNVGQITLSLPEDTNFNHENWAELVNDVRESLGLDDSYPYICIRHFDTEHPHAHLVFSRISVEGKVHDQSNLGLRCASAEQLVEQKYNLNLHPMRKDVDVRAPSKNEIEMQLRTGELSIRAKFQALSNDAMTDCDNIVTYFHRLQAAGFDLEITTQDEGARISGILLHLNGQTMKASDLGKKFTAAGLQKQGVLYDQDRDLQSIIEIQNRTALKQLEWAGGDLKIDQIRDSGADGRKNSASSAGHESIGSNPSGNSQNARNRDGEHLSKTEPDARTGREFQRAPAGQPTAIQSHLGYGNNSHQRASDLICDLANASTENIDEYGHKNASPANHRPASASYAARSSQIKALGGVGQEFQISILLPEGAKQIKGRFKFDQLTPEQQAEEDAFYSLPENKDKPRRKMLKRTPKNAEDFRTFAGFCAALNAEGADIYIAPHPLSKHSFVLIDDLTIENVNRMKNDGLVPSLLVQTSPNNFQSWLKLSDKSLSKKQLLECSRLLTNKYHGDTGAIGSDRIGRLAGFTNRKEKHMNHQGLQPYCLLEERRQEAATNGHLIIAQADELISNDITATERLKRFKAIESTSDYVGHGASPTQFYQTEAKKIIRRYPIPNVSKMDHMICKTMVENHFSDNQIGQALSAASPAINTRKDGHVEDYIRRTILKARAAAELQRQLQQAENEDKYSNDLTN